MTHHTDFDGTVSSPLIMTALLDRQSFALLDDLRRRFFPAALNRVAAHVTLFHHLPGRDLRAVSDETAVACRTLTPLPFAIADTRFLGRGVAFALSCPALVETRAALARTWSDRLTAQDRQAYRPHVTIQNKVEPAKARRTQRDLEALLPLSGTIEGLCLWHYRGGPWEEAGRFLFAG